MLRTTQMNELTPDSHDSERDVKISCRNVWKVYGPGAEQYFTRSDFLRGRGGARSMGCTRSQMLWQVKMPLALPEIMLGLNQTIMFGLVMLVIAALVGTKGLKQSVYIALGKANTGLGLVAGFSMAFITMISGRIIQAWSAQKKAALGLG